MSTLTRYNLKKNLKIKSQRFNSAKISSKLSSSLNLLSGSESVYTKRHTRNKTKLLLTTVLSTSKHYIINGNKPESSKSVLNNIIYKYPYKPDTFLKLEKKFFFDDKLNKFKNNIKQFNASSYDNSISTFKSSTNNTTVKNKGNNNFYYSNHNKKLCLLSPNMEMKNKNRNIKYKLNISKIINKDIKITEEKFLEYIDNINTDKNYINIYKNQINEYFDDNLNSNSMFLKDLLNDYQYNENENEDFFITDSHSVKINNFTIKNSEIIFKLSSLKLIFYEIKKEKLILNTKLKLPFEFLSIFYGLNFEEFINLLISLVNYNFDLNKFYIEYNHFINKVEEAKVLYDYFKENSFFNTYNTNKAKEFFLFDWDVKGKNGEIKHFCFKLLLPRIKVKINCDENNKIKFYSYININTINNLMKNSFKKWDLFIFVYFSQYKLFRYEINKIICQKYSGNQVYNLTNSFIKINSIRKNYNSYSFFFTLNKEEKSETYYIKFKLPKIYISYRSFNKNFELDLKRIYQLNKLRKYFLPEDIIKYSIIIKTYKNKINRKEEQRQKMKKVLFSSKTMKPTKRTSTRVSIDHGNKGNAKRFFKNKIKAKNEMIVLSSVMQKNYEYKEIIKDIDLNLDKYIFNIDESILKFIDIKDIHKNDKNDNNKINDNKDSIFNNNDTNKKLMINIDNLELSWTNKEGLTNSYKFDKKVSQELLDFPQNKWRAYVENNIENIVLGISNNERKKINKKFSFFQRAKVHF